MGAPGSVHAARSPFLMSAMIRMPAATVPVDHQVPSERDALMRPANIHGTETGMQPLPGADQESPQSDFKVDCADCHHLALLTPDLLLRLGLSPARKVLDLKSRVRCRGCGARGRAVVSIKWGGQGG